MVRVNVNNDNYIVKDFLKYLAVAVLMCGLSFFSGFLGSMTALFAVAPVILFYVNRKSLLLAVLMVFVAALMLSMVAGIDGGLYYMYEFGALNVFMLLMLSRETDFINIVFRSSLFAFIVIFIVTGSLAVIFGVNLHEVIAYAIDTNIEKAIEAYSVLDVPADQREQLLKVYSDLRALFKQIYPALLFVGFELIASINLFVVKRYFLKDEDRIDTSRISLWSPDEKWIFGLISFGFLYFVKSEPVHMIALNGLIIFLALYFFSGFCIVSYFFKEKKVSALMQGIIYFSIVFVNELKFLVIALGAFNIWFDFRKRIHKTDKVT